MARIYANENLYRPTVAKLRELGHDVLTSFEAGNANLKIPDEQVLLFAVTEGRIMLTLNRRHFMRLHRLHPDHCGIVVCTEDNDFESLALRIHEILTDSDDTSGQLYRAYRPNPS